MRGAPGGQQQVDVVRGQRAQVRVRTGDPAAAGIAARGAEAAADDVVVLAADGAAGAEAGDHVARQLIAQVQARQRILEHLVAHRP